MTAALLWLLAAVLVAAVHYWWREYQDQLARQRVALLEAWLIANGCSHEQAAEHAPRMLGLAP